MSKLEVHSWICFVLAGSVGKTAKAVNGKKPTRKKALLRPSTAPPIPLSISRRHIPDHAPGRIWTWRRHACSSPRGAPVVPVGGLGVYMARAHRLKSAAASDGLGEGAPATV